MMTSNWTIGKKLIALSIGLVVVPLGLVGGLSLRSVGVLNANVTRIATTRLQEDAEKTLSRGVKQAYGDVMAFMETIQNDTRKLAQSGTVNSYIEAMNGESETWNRATRERCDTLVRGFVEAAQIQNASTRQTLQSSLSLAELLMAQMGEFKQTDSTTEWKTINQLSREEQQVTLPKVTVGDTEFAQNFDAGSPTPLVDDIVKHVGGTATLFQRINASGDILRIATSVVGPDGKRAIGTYIPHTNPDGTANPVVAALLRKETFVGRAFVVNQWYMTAYKPLLNAAGETEGALYVGIPEQSGAIVESLNKTKIGEAGYPFVMNSKGELVVHPRSELVGKNTISDLKLTAFQEVVDKRKAGEYGWETYRFEGRLKFIAYSYFPEWDWILCASGYMDEMSASAAQQAQILTQRDMMHMFKASVVMTSKGEKPAYSQIRFLDAAGKEIIAVIDGALRTDKDLQTRQGETWFEEARKLPAGQLYITQVEIAKNTGEPEIRIATPVYVNDILQGVVVINADWNHVWERLSGVVFGKTGYPYIINEKGVLISHPKNTLKDNNSLADSRYGELAELVRNKMLRGEEGFGQYQFEGQEAYAAFTPLKLGASNYVIAARVPVEEFFEVSNEIQAAIGKEVKSLTWIVAITSVVLVVVGTTLGIFFSRGINRSLTRIAMQLGEGAEQVNDAAAQVSSASQSLAEGASEQASSLEETSSALEQMAAMTRTNAENSKQANELASQTRQAANEGDKSMVQLNEAMNGINDSSDKISKIIKVIEEIAFQTNLLALNAAVEAARAGEHGKGFAVVADEVRNLAQRCAQAARETTSLIEDAVNRAQQGTQVATEVGKSLSAIVGQAAKVSDLISGISQASQEQAQGVDQVNTAVSQMDKVTQQNASGAEQSASAAEQLAAQSQTVKGMVNELMTLVSGHKVIADSTSTTKAKRKTTSTQPPLKNTMTTPTRKSRGPAHVGVTNTKSKSDAEFLTLSDNEASLDQF